MRTAVRLLIPALVVLIVWLVWPYLESSEAQVERQQLRVLALAADRDWDAVRESMAADYKDQWAKNSGESLAAAKYVFSGFIALDIEWRTTRVTIHDNTAEVRGTAKMTGTGPAAAEVTSGVNSVKDPWIFTWRKEGAGPKGWKLLSVRNASLNVSVPAEASILQ